MVASGIILLIKRLLLLLAFNSIRLIFMLTQNIRWHVDGTAKKAKDAFSPENFHSCVQVLDIKGYFCFDNTSMAKVNLGNYIYTHNRFENPQYIYDNDNVSLMTITTHYAIFGEAREKEMELWRSTYSPFYRLAQIKFCNKLLAVPLNAFNRMADELGDPKTELIFLFHVGRCGSTMLTQMMEYSGKCVSISAPEAPKHLTILYGNKGGTDEVRHVTRSCVRWICRPYKNFQPMAYVIKFSPPVVCLLPLFKELYPTSRYLFMYRNMLNSAKSLYRVSRETPTLFLVMTLGRLHKSLSEICLKNLVGYGSSFAKGFSCNLADGLTFGLIVWIYSATSYLKFYQRGNIDIRAARYEDIVSDPIYAMRAILKHCNLPESLAENAVKGMEQDSQRNSPYSRICLRRHRDPDITPEGRMAINKLAKKQGVPTLDDDNLLPGTITTKLGLL